MTTFEIKVTETGGRQAAKSIAELDKAFADLEKQVTEFEESLDNAGESSFDLNELLGDMGLEASELSGKLGMASAVVGGTVGAVAALAAVVSENANNLLQQSDAIGVTTDMLGGLRLAVEQFGVDSDVADDILRTLSERIRDAAMGSAEALESFEALGVGIVDADGNMRAVDSTLGAVMDSLAGMSNETERTAIITTLLGDEAAKASGALIQGSDALREITAAGRDAGTVLDQETAKGLAALSEQGKQFRIVMEGLANKVAEIFVPGLTAIASAATSAANALSFAVTETKNLIGGQRRLAQLNQERVDGLHEEVDTLWEQINANKALEKSLREQMDSLPSNSALFMDHGATLEAVQEETDRLTRRIKALKDGYMEERDAVGEATSAQEKYTLALSDAANAAGGAGSSGGAGAIVFDLERIAATAINSTGVVQEQATALLRAQKAALQSMIQESIAAGETLSQDLLAQLQQVEGVLTFLQPDEMEFRARETVTRVTETFRSGIQEWMQLFDAFGGLMDGIFDAFGDGGSEAQKVFKGVVGTIQAGLRAVDAIRGASAAAGAAQAASATASSVTMAGTTTAAWTPAATVVNAATFGGGAVGAAVAVAGLVSTIIGLIASVRAATAADQGFNIPRGLRGLVPGSGGEDTLVAIRGGPDGEMVLNEQQAAQYRATMSGAGRSVQAVSVVQLDSEVVATSVVTHRRFEDALEDFFDARRINLSALAGIA